MRHPITASANHSLEWFRKPAPTLASPRRQEARRSPARALAVEMLEGRVVPATITVSSLADAGPGTLRAAITQADLDTTPDTIKFAPAVTGTITLVSALPDLSAAITIEGPGASVLTVARSSASTTPKFRIFTVPTGAGVAISGLTISKGLSPQDTLDLGSKGGGIYNGGKLIVTNSTISDNSAFIFSFGIGGGIYNTGMLSLTNVTVSGNNASESGGGIENTGTLTVTNSTISDNLGSGPGPDGQAWGFGGGIDNSGTATVTNSTVSGNVSGPDGGGIATSGDMTITNCTLSGNSANGGGSPFNFTQSSGGGISNFGTLTVTNSTLSGNSSEVHGGGINNRGTMTVTNCTLSENSVKGLSPFGNNPIGSGGGISNSGTLTVGNTIIARNKSNAGLPDVAGSLHSLGYNLVGDAVSSNGWIGTDRTGTTSSPLHPRLGPLADNGGPTFTQALLPGSPAIDTGITVVGVTTDQRGIPRPQGIAPDIGAFESRGFTLARVSGDNQQAQTRSAFPSPLVVQISSAFGEPVAGGQISFKTPMTGPSATFATNPVTLNASGQASVVATANGSGGPFVTMVGAAGANSADFRLTNLIIPPTVVGLRRIGIHRQPTHLVLNFSAPLDPARASDVRNYTLVRVGPAGRSSPYPRPIPVHSAVYDATVRSVTLTPRHRLNLHLFYRLTVYGTAPSGVAAIDGTLLAGSSTGKPGSDYVAVVHKSGTTAIPSTRQFTRVGSYKRV